MSSMYLFTPKCKVQFNLSCFTDCTKHASAGALIHQQFIIGFSVTQTKLSGIYNSHLLGLNETSRVSYNLGETQLSLFYFVFTFRLWRPWRSPYKRIIIIFLLLFGRQDPGEILASVWQEEENFEVLKRCYIQTYPTSFFFVCVLWKSCTLIFFIFEFRVE